MIEKTLSGTKLLASVTLCALPSRDDLAAFTRQGFRGVVVTERIVLASLESVKAARFVEFLRNGAGAGLRIQWSGDASGYEEQLWHLDPPQLANGKRQWVSSRVPASRVRFGPSFAQIFSNRVQAEQISVYGSLAKSLHLHLSFQPRIESATHAGKLQRELREKGLLIEIGDLFLTSPIRQQFGRPARSRGKDEA